MLPIIHPQRYISTLGTGANLPILISGIDEITHDEDYYVVKLMAGERMDTTANFRELVASLMAQEMGIPVVKPAIINITEDFVQSVHGSDCFQRVSESIGLNFGSKYISGYHMLTSQQPLNDDQIIYAQDVFWFDMLIQNPDRTKNKPNMFTNGKNIVIFDHELAFSFLLLIGGDADPWNITHAKWPFFDTLLLPDKLNSVNFDEERIVTQINKLDENFWHQTAALIPELWLDQGNFDRIIAHVKLVQEHSHEFVQQLNNMVNNNIIFEEPPF